MLGTRGDEEQEHHLDRGVRGLGWAGHVRIRAALTNGLNRDEIEEILLQPAIYCGVPSVNTAIKTAQQVFREMETTP